MKLLSINSRKLLACFCQYYCQKMSGWLKFPKYQALWTWSFLRLLRNGHVYFLFLIIQFVVRLHVLICSLILIHKFLFTHYPLRDKTSSSLFLCGVQMLPSSQYQGVDREIPCQVQDTGRSAKSFKIFLNKCLIIACWSQETSRFVCFSFKCSATPFMFLLRKY